MVANEIFRRGVECRQAEAGDEEQQQRAAQRVRAARGHQ
jgi:hypothetical protein